MAGIRQSSLLSRLYSHRGSLAERAKEDKSFASVLG
jgi:hypothetical protein